VNATRTEKKSIMNDSPKSLPAVANVVSMFVPTGSVNYPMMTGYVPGPDWMQPDVIGFRADTLVYATGVTISPDLGAEATDAALMLKTDGAPMLAWTNNWVDVDGRVHAYQPCDEPSTGEPAHSSETTLKTCLLGSCPPGAVVLIPLPAYTADGGKRHAETYIVTSGRQASDGRV
jgi:hypothetical protein